MRLTRTHLIIIIVLFVAISTVLIIYFWFNRSTTTAEEIEKDAVLLVEDQDTGDVFEEDPTLGDQGEEKRDVLVVGLEKIVEAGAFGEQLPFIKDALNKYIEERYKGQYDTVTIRPQGLESNNGITKATLRLGTSDKIYPIEITAQYSGRTQVVVRDPGGIFNSGVTVFGAD